jgi:cytochrome c oxidase subunit II
MKAIWHSANKVIVVLIALASLSVCQGHADTKVAIITIHAKRYEFIPSEITLKQGQEVKLVFISNDVPHGIAIMDLGVSLDFRKSRRNQVIITPDKVGTFIGVCSRYCGAGHDRMTFTVHVMP